MEQVTVIGTGLMGSTITLAIAWADMPVTIYGLDEDETQTAMNYVKSEVQILIENQLINQDKAKKNNQPD